jgi:hypothetical protein
LKRVDAASFLPFATPIAAASILTLFTPVGAASILAFDAAPGGSVLVSGGGTSKFRRFSFGGGTSGACSLRRAGRALRSVRSLLFSATAERSLSTVDFLTHFSISPYFPQFIQLTRRFPSLSLGFAKNRKILRKSRRKT